MNRLHLKAANRSSLGWGKLSLLGFYLVISNESLSKKNNIFTMSKTFIAKIWINIIR